MLQVPTWSRLLRRREVAQCARVLDALRYPTTKLMMAPFCRQSHAEGLEAVARFWSVSQLLPRDCCTGPSSPQCRTKKKTLTSEEMLWRRRLRIRRTRERLAIERWEVASGHKGVRIKSSNPLFCARTDFSGFRELYVRIPKDCDKGGSCCALKSALPRPRQGTSCRPYVTMAWHPDLNFSVKPPLHRPQPKIHPKSHFDLRHLGQESGGYIHIVAGHRLASCKAQRLRTSPARRMRHILQLAPLFHLSRQPSVL